MMDSYGLYRRDALLKTELYLSYFGSEKILLAELSLHGRYAEVDEPLFFSRVHDEAAGSLQSAAQHASHKLDEIEIKISRNPFTAVLIALGLGFVIGLMNRR